MVPDRRRVRIGRRRQRGRRIDHHRLEQFAVRHLGMLDVEHIVFQPPARNRGKPTRAERIRNTPGLHHAGLDGFAGQNRSDHERRDRERPLFDRPGVLGRPGLPIDARRRGNVHIVSFDHDILLMMIKEWPAFAGHSPQNLARRGVELSGTAYRPSSVITG